MLDEIVVGLSRSRVKKLRDAQAEEIQGEK